MTSRPARWRAWPTHAPHAPVHARETTINAKPATWDKWIRALWRDRVEPRFRAGETCSLANYFTPRPYQDEWSPGSAMAGFVYVVEPGRRVCFVEWRAVN